jgi:hypothetical protein
MLTDSRKRAMSLLRHAETQIERATTASSVYGWRGRYWSRGAL